MALRDTGDRLPTLTGVNARALDDDGNAVIIAASDEAVQDHDWGSIFAAASRKHATGEYDQTKQPPMIRVTTADCE